MTLRHLQHLPLASRTASLSLALGLALVLLPGSALADPLPSWREGPSKRAILQFVQRATGNGNGEAGAIPPAERIAVFDNDGTLWSEQPLYIPALFCIDRIRQLAPANPAWRHQEPYASALRGDLAGLLRQGPTALTTLLLASSSGMTSEAFAAEVRRWIATARHPVTGQPYTALVFQPMLELLAFLRSRGFRTYIVSGGDAAFLRPWSEAVYGIPPEQVIGTRLKLAYRDTPGGPVLERLPVLEALVDGAEKPVAIEQILGRRPVAAFGNSDGDRQMLTWTMAGPGPRFALLVHHTDARREWAYDRLSPVGRLHLALDQARRQGWTVVDMAREWTVIHPLTPLAPLRSELAPVAPARALN
jgi:hypothetical protein